jgi:hypothetical protein
MKLTAEFIALRRSSGEQVALTWLDALEFDDDRQRSEEIASLRLHSLHRQARYNEAIAYAEAHEHLSTCKTHLKVEIALAHYRAGRIDEAVRVLESAPMDEEIDRWTALVREGVYLLAFLLNQRGDPVPEELRAMLPEDYIQITDRGRRLGMEVLAPAFRDKEY